MPPKTILITGCSAGGIGDGLAQAFHRRGQEVIATARSLSKIQHLKELGITVLALDVTIEASLKEAVEKVSAITGGRLDILVNNAGLLLSMPMLDVDIKDARRVFDVNYFGVLATVQAFAPLIIPAKGKIVNVNSIAEFVPVPWLGVYNSSKAALGMYSNNLRQELSPFGVQVINISTGGVKTKIQANQILKPLPQDSIYLPAKDKIEWIMEGNISKQYVCTIDEYVEKVVKNVLYEKTSSRLYLGDSATLMWAMFTLLWYNVWDMAFGGMYGLKELKKAIKAKEKTT